MYKRSCGSRQISNSGTPPLFATLFANTSSECTVLAIQHLTHIIILLVPRHPIPQPFHPLHTTASHRPNGCIPFRASTLQSKSPYPVEIMCWVTLTPSKGKKKGYRPTSDSSCVEDIVRVHHNPASPRLTNVRIRAPSLDVEVDEKLTHAHLYPHLQHHHRHPHLHPLHMHPVEGEHHLGMSFGLGHHHHHHHRGSLDMSEISDIKLRGHGRRRSISSPCPPPPPSTCPPASPPPAPPSSSSSSSSPPPRPTAPRDTSPLLPPSVSFPSPREPIYRTQIIQPPSSRNTAVRETTRVALRTSTTERRPRQNLRRVAGYQVLGRQVPWDWDCVSSTVGSSTAATAGGARGKWVRRKSGGAAGLKYPPFGDAEKWM